MPERLVPGTPLRFASTLPLAGYGRGVVCTSFEGRPTKVEGNPRHPASQGSTDLVRRGGRPPALRPRPLAHRAAAVRGQLLGGLRRGDAGPDAGARGRRRCRAAPADRPHHLADARTADRRDPVQVPAGPLAPLRAGRRRQRAARGEAGLRPHPRGPVGPRPGRRDPRARCRPARRRARPDPQRPRVRRAAHGAAGRGGDVPPLRGRAADDADRRQRRQPAGFGAARRSATSRWRSPRPWGPASTGQS